MLQLNTADSIRDGKCLFPDATLCGISPDILTMASAKSAVEQSRSMFARKIDPTMPDSLALVDYIDRRRGTNIKGYSRGVFNWDRNRDGSSDLIAMIQVSSHAQDHMSIDASYGRDITSRCITFPITTGEKAFIRFDKCDPQNEQQWIVLGKLHNIYLLMMIYIKHCIGYYIAYLVDRCSPNYEVTIEDGKCPVFKKKPSVSSASITAPSIINNIHDDIGQSKYKKYFSTRAILYSIVVYDNQITIAIRYP